VEQYNLLMASGDIPDVVLNSVLNIKNYYQAWQPVIDPIKADTRRYPNMNKYMIGDEYLDSYLTDPDGKSRIIPMLASRRTGDILMIRKDLLAKYGEKEPVTADDWHRVLTKAKADGKIPYMTRMQRAGIFWRLLSGYTEGLAEDYTEENGKIVYGVLEPRFKAAVELARQWYAEGLIDREYPTTGATQWSEAVLRGDVFAYHDNSATRTFWANEQYIRNNTNFRVEGVGPMQSPTSTKRITKLHYPRVRDSVSAISVNAKNADRILDFYEYCFSDEGFLLQNFGIEGISFEYQNGNPVLLPEYNAADLQKKLGQPGFPVNVGTINTKGGYPGINMNELLFLYEDTSVPANEETRKARDLYEAHPEWIQNHWIASLSFTQEEKDILNPIKAELDTYRGEMLDKFVMGIEPMSRWDDFTAQIRRMNLDTTIKIYQDALDRILKK
jgi:putative aldouronate transport system substrate-binding protein